MASGLDLMGYSVAALFALLGVALEAGARYYGHPGGAGRYAFMLAVVAGLMAVAFSLLSIITPPA